MNLFILFTMIFCHIVDDYYLQGVLANMKQKTWWQHNTRNELYKYDYLIALFMHSFSWSFMIMLPIAVSLSFNINIIFVVSFLANIIIHFRVDDEKANKLSINLILDQLIHIAQILFTWMLFYL